MDSGLRNRKPRVSLIQRLDGSVSLLRRKGEKLELEIGEPLQEIRVVAASPGWRVGVEHLQMRKIEGL